MDTLFAPWRMDYILKPKADSCVFCISNSLDKDEENLILARFEHTFVIMNRYPYSNGHLMVCPYEHISTLEELSLAQRHELIDVTSLCINILKQAMNPQGFNTGMNLGDVAGAGIASHLHFQIVPRWVGDASFMAILAETQVIPEHLQNTYKKLLAFFKKQELL